MTFTAHSFNIIIIIIIIIIFIIIIIIIIFRGASYSVRSASREALRTLYEAPPPEIFLPGHFEIVKPYNYLNND